MYKLKHRKTGQKIEVTDREYRGYPFYRSSFEILSHTSDDKPVEIEVEPKKKPARKRRTKKEE